MNTTDESRDPDVSRDEVEAEASAGEPATAPSAVVDIERAMERRRIGLQILAVVVPWRDALRDLNVAERDLFRVRAHALLNYLDVAVKPYPDLQHALASARLELAQERPAVGSQPIH